MAGARCLPRALVACGLLAGLAASACHGTGEGAGLAGRWSSTVDSPGGPMHLHVDVVETSAGPRAWLDVPEDFVLARALPSFRAGGDEVEFELQGNGGSLRFRGQRSGPTWSGSATARELELPLVFTRSGPVPARPYAEEALEFGSGGLRLQGSLLVPAGSARVPAVVLLHGSTSPRREDFRFFADAFARAGIAALIFDKRDGGGGRGHASRFSLLELAADARAATAALARHARIDAQRIGLWGLSQGGWVAPLAAAEDPAVAFVVAISGPSSSFADVQRYQIENYLRGARGVGPEELAQALALLGELEAWARAGGGPDAELARRLADAHAAPWGRAIEVFERLPSAADLREELRWRDLDLDPDPYWRRVRVPVLAVYGSADRQIPVAPTVERLRAALAANPAARIEVLAGGDHELHRCEDYPRLVIDWVRALPAPPSAPR